MPVTSLKQSMAHKPTLSIITKEKMLIPIMKTCYRQSILSQDPDASYFSNKIIDFSSNQNCHQNKFSLQP